MSFPRLLSMPFLSSRLPDSNFGAIDFSVVFLPKRFVKTILSFEVILFSNAGAKKETSFFSFPKATSVFIDLILGFGRGVKVNPGTTEDFDSDG